MDPCRPSTDTLWTGELSTNFWLRPPATNAQDATNFWLRPATNFWLRPSLHRRRSEAVFGDPPVVKLTCRYNYL